MFQNINISNFFFFLLLQFITILQFIIVNMDIFFYEKH